MAFQSMADEFLPFIENQHPELITLSMLDIYKLYFDEEIEQIFIKLTEKYAREHKNDPTFVLSRDELWDFIVMITISCYNTRPQFSMYWSTDDDTSCPLIRSLMARNKFTKIKSCIHVCDNDDLDLNDKWSKLRPLINAVNDKLVQFGVFSKHLSIDEQMVPYFGRHSCKMFIRGKPIRFGFKNWVLAADDGYPFKVVPYQGKEPGAAKGLLGPKVVTGLLEVVQHPARHEVYFDNFFTSIPLLLKPRENGMKATGTVRNNRTGNCPLTNVKTMQKRDRGEMEVYSHKDVCAVRWVDNKVVTVISNTHTNEPVSICKRYSCVEKAKVDLPQPDCIKKYNSHMGGVDQLDSYLNNLRPSIGGNKWYWTQLVNWIRLLQVAAFRLLSRLHPDEKVSQLVFLRGIVHQYIRFQSSIPISPDDARLVQMAVNSHALAPFTQGRCKVCQKNTKKGCQACNVRLHERCFPLFHI